MNTTPVYDLPTRLFHWLFGAGLLSAFAIAKLVDDESIVFSIHMMIGIIVFALVLLRLAWGFIGTRYARFSSFELKLGALRDYFAGVFAGRPPRKLGHNPASSWAALILMALALGLGATGYLMTTRDEAELFEELHEVFATAFIFVAAGHVMGVLLHTWRHRDALALAVVRGAKKSIDGQAGIASARRGSALALVMIVAALGVHLVRNFNPATRTLVLFGAEMRLGEAEGD